MTIKYRKRTEKKLICITFSKHSEVDGAFKYNLDGYK